MLCRSCLGYGRTVQTVVHDDQTVSFNEHDCEPCDGRGVLVDWRDNLPDTGVPVAPWWV